MWNHFAELRRAGLGTGLSQAKLTKTMVEVLLQLPPDTAPSKDLVVGHLGLIGQMSTTRDLNAAWNNAKKQMLRDYPGRFRLVGKALRLASETDADRPSEKLSAASLRRRGNAGREGGPVA